MSASFHSVRSPLAFINKAFPLALGLAGRVGRHLPSGFVSAHLVAALEGARLAGWLTPPAELTGKRFSITIEDAGLRFSFTCQDGRFRPLWQTPTAYDLTIAASAADMLSLAQGLVDADTLFFQRRLKINGDTSLGLIVKNWLDSTERPQWLTRLAEGVDLQARG